MSELPKSIALEGRRYPTWALSLRARKQLTNLEQVDKHIAELRQRLAFCKSARDICQRHLREALPEKCQPAPRYYWQIASLEWVRANWPVKAITLDLQCLGEASHYREGDCVLVYVKGYGVIGWGSVEVGADAKQRHLIWRFVVAELSDALPAKALNDFSVRYPNRISQMLRSSAGITGLLQALESRPAALKMAK